METTAYHESGHTFVAYYLGGYVNCVTVDPDFDEGPARSGDVEVYWPTPFSSQRKAVFAQTQVALAGPAAEMVYLGEPWHPAFVKEWKADWETAIQLFRSIDKDATRGLDPMLQGSLPARVARYSRPSASV